MTVQSKPMQAKVGIIRNEKPETADDWIKACVSMGIGYSVIDISANNWLDRILESKVDFFVSHPSGSYERFKTMFDERLYIISSELGFRIFPNFTESLIYENKRMLSYYLKSHNIPHAKTFVYYNNQEAQEYALHASYPFVAKTNIGASGAGVKIITNKQEALSYIHKAFKGRGIRRRFGPNRVTGSPRKWARKSIISPSYLLRRIKLYLEISSNAQFGYVIFQEYVPHDFEWRVVKIGESLFAHKKIKMGDKASGALAKQYGLPPNGLLDFVNNLCAENKFHSVCVDLFESDNSYLVNEIQCVFGNAYGHLSKVGDEVGRFLKKDGIWVFDRGNFTSNNCCDLKLNTAIKLFLENVAVT